MAWVCFAANDRRKAAGIREEKNNDVLFQRGTKRSFWTSNDTGKLPALDREGSATLSSLVRLSFVRKHTANAAIWSSEHATTVAGHLLAVDKVVGFGVNEEVKISRN
jgi:hypothetical protein